MRRREVRQAERARRLARRRQGATPPGVVPVQEKQLEPYNSFGTPAFVRRGFYLDVSFRCASCGQAQVWTAAQQKWWYEVAKGSVDSTAKLCRPCRRRAQRRKAEARRVHLEGLARKKARS